mmetsp:Transcript_15899/g.49423  ORF Transcript_15899/g.49423 Transcript_15899/m.49423 type:complete len:201 (-) Transcript_15899:60-662(-)
MLDEQLLAGALAARLCTHLVRGCLLYFLCLCATRHRRRRQRHLGGGIGALGPAGRLGRLGGPGGVGGASVRLTAGYNLGLLASCFTLFQLRSARHGCLQRRTHPRHLARMLRAAALQRIVVPCCRCAGRGASRHRATAGVGAVHMFHACGRAQILVSNGNCAGRRRILNSAVRLKLVPRLRRLNRRRVLDGAFALGTECQ